MSNFAINGLVSGLDTDSIVRAIMNAERLPQQAIQKKISTYEREVKAFQDINSKVSGLHGLADDFLKDDVWSAVKTSSSNESVTVNAASQANMGKLSFDVLQVAKQHSELSPVMTWEEGVTEPAASTIEFHSVPKSPPASLLAQVGIDNADPTAVAAAVNSAGIGFTAQAIQVAPNQYRLQVTRTEGGVNGAFSFNIDTTPPTDSSTLEVGQNAIVSFGPGFTVESETNTFKDITTGVDISVTEPATGVQVSTERDAESTTTKVEELFGSLNEALTQIGTATNVVPGDASASGVLVGSSAMRNLSMQLVSASSGFAGGSSASEAGIEVTRYGKIKFDATKFEELMAKDPAAAQAIVNDVVGRVRDVADQYSNSSSGILSTAIKNKNSDVSGLQDQVEAWDLRLEMKRASLVKQFTAMEQAMSQFQGQASWLGSQLAGMNGGQQ